MELSCALSGHWHWRLLYTTSKIQSIVGTERVELQKDLSKFDSIVVAVSHSQYADIPVPTLLKSTKKGTLVVDAEGTWESYKHFFLENGIDYRKIGDAVWAAIRKN